MKKRHNFQSLINRVNDIIEYSQKHISQLNPTSNTSISQNSNYNSNNSQQENVDPNIQDSNKFFENFDQVIKINYNQKSQQMKEVPIKKTLIHSFEQCQIDENNQYSSQNSQTNTQIQQNFKSPNNHQRELPSKSQSSCSNQNNQQPVQPSHSLNKVNQGQLQHNQNNLNINTQQNQFYLGQQNQQLVSLQAQSNLNQGISNRRSLNQSINSQRGPSTSRIKEFVNPIQLQNQQQQQQNQPQINLPQQQQLQQEKRKPSYTLSQPIIQNNNNFGRKQSAMENVINNNNLREGFYNQYSNQNGNFIPNNYQTQNLINYSNAPPPSNQNSQFNTQQNSRIQYNERNRINTDHNCGYETSNNGIDMYKLMNVPNFFHTQKVRSTSYQRGAVQLMNKNLKY